MFESASAGKQATTVVMETTFEIPTTVDPTIDAFFDRATDNDSDDVSAFETTSSYDGEEDVGDGYFEFGLYQVRHTSVLIQVR